MKRLAALTAMMIVLLGAGVAFAYWTAEGTGTGTATTGTIAGLQVVQTSTITDLAPGSGPQTLSGTFNNTSDIDIDVKELTVDIGMSGIVAARPSELPVETLRQWLDILQNAIASEQYDVAFRLLRDAIPEFTAAAE